MIYLYYLLLLLLPFYIWVHIPQLTQTLTLIKMVGILTAVAAFVKLVTDPKPLYLFRFAENKLFLVLVGMVIVSEIRTVFVYGSPTPMLWSYVSHAVALFATLVFLDSIEKVRMACYVLMFSMIVASATVFKDYIRWNISRPGGVAGDPNYYGLIVLCLLPMPVFFFKGSSPAKKIFLAITGFSMLASMLLGASRGGLIGLVITLVYLLVSIRNKALYLLSAPVVLILCFLLLPRTGLDRFLQPSYGDVQATAGRLELWKAGLNMIEDHPLLGVGVGLFKPLSSKYNPNVLEPQIAHSTYVEMAAEMGLPALLVFLSIIFLGWNRARKLGKYFRDRRELSGEVICSSIAVGIVGFSMAAVFLSAAYIRHFWIILFLNIAVQRIILLQQARQAVPNATAPTALLLNNSTIRIPAGTPVSSGRVKPRRKSGFAVFHSR